MKRKVFQQGFTLIELLVVMVIFSIIAGITVSILFSVLRGANKANTIITLRQTGDYAVDQVTRIIRNGKTLSCDPNNTYIDVTEPDNQVTRLICSGNQLASQSAHPATLIDNSTVSASCNFSCNQDPTTQIPVVNFTLNVQQVSGSSPEKSASLPFFTSVVMRNYGQ